MHKFGRFVELEFLVVIIKSSSHEAFLRRLGSIRAADVAGLLKFTAIDLLLLKRGL